MSKKTYILVDSLNMFFRAKHVGGGRDIDMRVGMAMHIMFNSIKKVWRDFDGDHVVMCLEGRSWRKDFYPPYKANRKVLMDKRSVREQEDDELFFESYNDLTKFLEERTNVSVIQQPNAEADDLIATWIQQHPDVDHVVVSTDTDFQQLIAPNVKLYNGVQEVTTTHEGFFDKKGNHVIDKKTKEPKTVPDPQWLLFEKCMRGDTSDNVFSAYPGVRKKGTRNKVGLLEAFEDKDLKGYNWNNLMLQRWVDHNGEEHRVLDDYQRNVILCDLTAQPGNIRSIINDVIEEHMTPKEVQQVGMRLMKFCAKWDMQRIADQAQYYAEPLQARYPV